MATQTKLSGKVKVNDNLDYVDIEMHLTVKVPGKDTPQSCYEVALVPYYEDEKTHKKFVLLQKKYYIEVSELRRRTDERDPDLENIYKADLLNPSFIWLGNGSNGGTITRFTAGSKDLGLSSIIHSTTANQKELWWYNVVGQSLTHEKEQKLSGKDLIARLRLAVPRLGAGRAARIVIIPREHTAKWADKVWAQCLQFALADCKKGGGGDASAYQVTVLSSDKAIPVGYHKVGISLMNLYDTYMHSDDFRDIHTAHLATLGLAGQGTKALWRPYPDKNQANEVQALLDATSAILQIDIDPVKPQPSKHESDSSIHFDMNGVTIASKVGKPRSISQNQVMQKVGAPMAAKTIWGATRRSIGVQGTVGPNQFAPLLELSDDLSDRAEWLHLAAHSFGAIEDGEEFNNPQVPENLVFGTKEANGAMLRAEVAISTLLKYEQRVADYMKSVIIQYERPVDEGGYGTKWVGKQVQKITVSSSGRNTQRDKQLDAEKPWCDLEVERIRGPNSQTQVYRLDIDGETHPAASPNDPRLWWETIEYQSLEVLGWFAPSLWYRPKFYNTWILDETTYGIQFDMFSLYRPLLLEYYLDRAVLQQLALYGVERAVESAGFQFDRNLFEAFDRKNAGISYKKLLKKDGSLLVGSDGEYILRKAK